MGFAGVYLFFLFLLQNIDCGYSLEPPRRVPTIYVLSKNKKIIKTFFAENFHFLNFKNLCILHGQVFVMGVCFQVSAQVLYIRKTCPCNVYPLEPHFYIAKLGNAGVNLFFLFLLQNINCKAVLTCTHNLCFEQK